MPSLLIAILACAVIALALYGAFYAALPWIIQPLLRVMLWPRYSIRVVGRENVPRSGPTLLAANHASWLDGFFLAATAPRQGKALVSADIIKGPILRPLAVRAGMIPTPFTGPRAIRVAIETTRKVLNEGHGIGLFPEGQISRNGLTGPFYRGLEVILQGRTDVAVVPVAIDNVWGSLFSYSGGRFFKKRPQGLRRTINIVYGPPIPAPVTAFAVRQALLEGLVRAYAMRPKPRSLPETIDLSLPHWKHPTLGLLTASANDINLVGIHQAGQKPGTVGLPVPGVAIRVVNPEGSPLLPDQPGKIEAFVADSLAWTDTGAQGKLDPGGLFRYCEDPASAWIRQKGNPEIALGHSMNCLLPCLEDREEGRGAGDVEQLSHLGNNPA